MLTAVQSDVSWKKAQARLGRVETVILDETDGRWAWGRTAWEAPEIDAVVKIPKKELPRGKQFADVLLTRFEAYEYSGKGVKSQGYDSHF